MNSLVSTKPLSERAIDAILRRAQLFLTGQVHAQKQATLVNLFFEPSTRTSLSFQMAAHRLGITLMDFPLSNSSLKKGESLLDTLQTLEALGVDMAVIRHREDWPRIDGVEAVNMSLINAGSGIYEHPTQALLDALTMQQHFGSLRGRKVTIVGDVFHSRVARSNYDVLRKLGANVHFAGPAAYIMPELATAWEDLDEAVRTSDVLMMLRIQHERHENQWEMGSDYNKLYGLNAQRLRRMREQAIIMHPGPVNRGVEITDEVMNHPRAHIQQQVTNGVVVRMAVLEWCLQEVMHEQLATA